MPVASTSDGLWGWGRPYQDPELDIPGMQLQINPAYKGRTTWDTGLDGPLILEPNGKVISYTVTSLTTGNLTFQLWGAGGGGGGQDSNTRGGVGAAGGYVEATVAVPVAKTAFTVGTGTGGNVGVSNKNGTLDNGSGLPGSPGAHAGADPGTSGSSGGGGGGGGYSSVTLGTKWLLVASGGGGGGGGGNSLPDGYVGFHSRAMAAQGQSTISLSGNMLSIKPVQYYQEGWTETTKMTKPWNLDGNISVRPADGGGHGGGGGGWFQGWTANSYVGLNVDLSGFGGNNGANFANVANVALINPASVISITYSSQTAEQFQWTPDTGDIRNQITLANDVMFNGIEFDMHDRSLPYGFWNPTLANVVNQDFYVGRGGDYNDVVSFWANASANIGNGGNGRVVVSSTYPFFDVDGKTKADAIDANISIKTLEGVNTVFYSPATKDINSCVVIKSIGYDAFGNLAFTSNAVCNSMAYPTRVQNLESTANLIISAPGGNVSDILGFPKSKCYSYRFQKKNQARSGNSDRTKTQYGQGSALVYADNDDTGTYLRQWWTSSRTIEMWTKVETPTQAYDNPFPNQVSYTRWGGSTDWDYTSFAFGFNVNNQLVFYAGSGNTLARDSTLSTGVAGRYTTGTTVINTGEWVHIALTWDAATRSITGFLNGKEEFKVTVKPTVTWNVWSTNYYSYSRFSIGHAGYKNRSSDVRRNVEGFISNLRISKTIRYTGAFTPPTNPFTMDSDTFLLSCHRPDVMSEGIVLKRSGSIFVSGDTPFNLTTSKNHNLVANGPLVFDRPGAYTFTATANISVPIKMWGGSGGCSNTVLGGAGGYTHGIVKLEKDATYKVIVGEAGSGHASPGILDGAETTGSQVFIDDSYSYEQIDPKYDGGGGGGGTAILKISGATETPILVAGGGGGSANWLTRYTAIAYSYYGGAGGGGQGQGTPAIGEGHLSPRDGGIGGDYRGLMAQGLQGYPNGAPALFTQPTGNNGGGGFSYATFGGGSGYGNGGAGGWQYTYSSSHYLAGGGGGGGYGGGSGGFYDTQDRYTSNQYGPYQITGGGGGGGYVNPSYVTTTADTFTGVNYVPANSYDPVRLRVDGADPVTGQGGYEYYCAGGPPGTTLTSPFGAHPGLVVIYA